MDDIFGHAWVIDGAMAQHNMQTIAYPPDARNPYGRTSTGVLWRRQLLHCNFGWGGHCDGYYVEDVFNLKKGPVFIEEGNGDGGGSDDYHYDWCYRIIEY